MNHLSPNWIYFLWSSELYWFCLRSLFSTCCIIIGLLDSNKNEVEKNALWDDLNRRTYSWAYFICPGTEQLHNSFHFVSMLFFRLVIGQSNHNFMVKWPQVYCHCTADHGHSMWNWVTEQLRNWLIFGFTMLLCYSFFVIGQFNDLLSCQRGVDIDFIFVKLIVNQSVSLQK